MQEGNQTNSHGVVRWVDPSHRNLRGRKTTRTRTGNRNHDTIDATSIQSKNDPTFTRRLSDGQISQASNKSTIDFHTCRTICTFIEEHLRELRNQQVYIDKARARIQETGPSASFDANIIARNNLTKIKIRDEQTKANETIRRLTSYLRELTHIERSCNREQGTNQTDHVVANKLSDIRTEIIQSLNDFVLANSDIDVPIVYPDDLKCVDSFDLCTDALVNTRDLGSSNAATNHSKLIENTSVSDGFCDNIGEEAEMNAQLTSTDVQIENLAKRKKEVAKLERDTEELRRLFSDFYDLIKTQGEQLDSIEDNIAIASQRISEGHNHLNKTMKGLTVLMPVTGCMAGALIGGPLGLVVGGKLGGLTLGCASSLLGLLSSYSLQRCVSPDRINSH